MSGLTPSAIVRAGGIVATQAKVDADVRVGEIAARRYAHPALPGRTIVRVVPDVMAPGADVEMETLGFARGEVRGGLGKGRFRSLGFPGWALVNDPAHAKFALEVMKDFKHAAKQVRSKPGNARDAFLEIGKRLARSVPHFLPSFWEEAGRRFIAEDSTTFAAQAFEKARLAEKEHALPVDEDVRSAVYLEFALAGAIAAKSLAGYAKELEEAYGAEAAYPRYLELATRRVLGGMPPWTGLAKELRALAKSAKKDLPAEDDAFLAAVLEAPAITRSPGELWTTYEAALLRLAKARPAVRKRLRHLFPEPSSRAKDFGGWWFDLLLRAGALDGLWDESVGADEAEPTGAASEWLGKAIRFTNGAAALHALLEKLTPRLAREGKPVAVVYVPPGRRQNVALDFAETLLAAGVPVAEPTRWVGIDLAAPFTCDPVHVQADPVLGPRLLLAVEPVLGTPAFEASSAGKKGLARARRAWLEREVSRLTSRGLFDLGHAAARLQDKVTPALWAEHPDLVAAVQKTEVGTALARTLRGGVFAEWTWPVYEELAARETKLTLDGAWPFPVLRTATRAIVLGAERVLFQHDFHLPPKATVNRCLFVDGDLLVTLSVVGSSMQAYWASSPTEVFDLEGYLYWHDLQLSAPLAGGGVSLGERAIHRGDRSVKTGPPVLTDGQTVWTLGWDDGRFKLFELDVKTGTKGRASWPAFVEGAASTTDDGQRLLAVSLAVAPEGVTASPLGQKDGLLGVYARGPAPNTSGPREVVRIDGVRWKGAGAEAPSALVSWPGDARARAIYTRRQLRAEGGYGVAQLQIEDDGGAVVAALGGETPYEAGWPSVPHLFLWCFLRPRDEAGSREVRALSDAAAKALLERVIAEPSEVAPSVAAAFPGVTKKPLAEGIASIARHAATLQLELAKVVARTKGDASAPSSPKDDTVLDSAFGEALGVFADSGWSNAVVSDELAAVSDDVRGAGARSFTPSRAPWERLVGRLRGVALFATLPGTTPERRETIGRLLRVFARTVFAEGRLRMRWFTGSMAKTSPVKPTAAQSWVARHDGSTYVFHTPHVLSPATTEWLVTALELREGGDFVVPPGVTLREERAIAHVDDTAFLESFAELASQAPPPWDPAAADVFAAEAGVTRAEAVLILAGLPNLRMYGADFLGKELRERLGLKTTDAKAAREVLQGLPKEKLLELYARGAPEDPRELLRPWAESGLALRLARAYGEVFGARVAVREDLIAACERELDPPLPSATLLTAVATDKDPPFFRCPEPTFDAAFKWQSTPPSDVLSSSALTSLVGLVSWLYLMQPSGDPYRAAVPRLMSAIDRVLADPKLLLPLRFLHAGTDVAGLRAVVDTVRGEPLQITLANDPAERAVDSGAIIAATFRAGATAAFAFRPAKVLPEDPAVRAIASSSFASWGAGTGAAYHAVALLRSEGLRAIVARIERAGLPDGAYEANPSVSMPALVATVGKAKKLSDDAACHYLQLLGLLEPTAKSVQTWNGWKPAQYKKTCEELLAKKLVVAGKRERAGREVFLPGAWEKGKDKNLPTEGWKKALYEDGAPGGAAATMPRTLPLRPLPEIWTAAWKRIEAGDVPKLEEV